MPPENPITDGEPPILAEEQPPRRRWHLKPIHFLIALLGLAVLGASFLPWRELCVGGELQGQTIPSRCTEQTLWDMTALRAKIGVGLALFSALCALVWTGRRPISDMTAEWTTRTAAIGAALFIGLEAFFLEEPAEFARLKALGVDAEMKYAIGLFGALGAVVLQVVLAVLNRKPSWVPPAEEDEEYAEGEYAEGEYGEEGEDGEYAEGDGTEPEAGDRTR